MAERQWLEQEKDKEGKLTGWYVHKEEVIKRRFKPEDLQEEIERKTQEIGKKQEELAELQTLLDNTNQPSEL